MEVTIADVGPAIFSTSGDGTGQGAVVVASSRIWLRRWARFRDRNQSREAISFDLLHSSGGGEQCSRRWGAGDRPTPPLATTVANPSVTIGGVPAVVSYSGLAPGLVGLYQVKRAAEQYSDRQCGKPCDHGRQPDFEHGDGRRSIRAAPDGISEGLAATRSIGPAARNGQTPCRVSRWRPRWSTSATSAFGKASEEQSASPRRRRGGRRAFAGDPGLHARRRSGGPGELPGSAPHPKGGKAEGRRVLTRAATAPSSTMAATVAPRTGSAKCSLLITILSRPGL